MTDHLSIEGGILGFWDLECRFPLNRFDLRQAAAASDFVARIECDVMAATYSTRRRPSWKS